MLRQPVESSAITSIGYAADSQVLEVEFHGGHVYRYFDVPATEHQALLTADSIGAYMNESIKPHYRFEEV